MSPDSGRGHRTPRGAYGVLLHEFVSTCCDNGTLMDDAVAGLPYFLEVELPVATDHPFVEREVAGLPGVGAVHRVPA